MFLREWNDLPNFMKCKEVRPYYERLRRRRFQLILKRLFDLLMAIVMITFFSIPMIIVAIIIKMVSSIIYTDATVYIFFSLMVIIGTIVAVVKSSNEIESENIKKFTNVVVGFLKVFAFFLLMIFVFSLLGLMGLGEKAFIVVAILLIIFSYFAAKMLGLKNDKIEIVAFIEIGRASCRERVSSPV